MSNINSININSANSNHSNAEAKALIVKSNEIIARRKVILEFINDEAKWSEANDVYVETFDSRGQRALSQTIALKEMRVYAANLLGEAKRLSHEALALLPK